MKDVGKKEKPKQLVERLRNDPSLAALNGDKLLLPLTQAVDQETGGRAGVSPFKTHIDRFCGKKPTRSPKLTALLGLAKENDRLALKLRAYPSINSDLRIIDEWASFAKNFWIAAANQIQHAIQQKDWERLKKLTTKETVDAFWDLLNSKKNPVVPVEIKRDCTARFMMACSKGKASKDKDTGLPDNKGYPSASCPPEEISILFKFNGQNIFGSGEDLSNTYIEVGPPETVPNHTARTGKYRAKRTLRKVKCRLNAKSPWFEFDVLFHLENNLGLPFNGFAKDIRVLREELNGKKIWYIVFSIEKPKTFSLNPRSFFGAADWNCRQDKSDPLLIEVFDVGFVDQYNTIHKKTFTYKLQQNRRSRRRLAGITKGMEDMPPLDQSREGMKNYKRVIDKRKDSIKQKYSLNQLCGWRSIRQIAELGMQAKSAPENLSDEDILFFKSEIQWYDKAMQGFRFLCRDITERKKTDYFKMARESGQFLLDNGVTDIGSPDDDIKGMAEEKGKTKKKRKEAKESGEEFKEDPNYKLRMKNKRNENRQEVALGELRRICEWIWNKMGICVHRVNPWKTSQRCPSCRTDTKSTDKVFTCSGCETRLDRGDVAIFNGVTLAKTCSETDTHPHLCSKKKDKDFIALPGYDDWLLEKTKQKEQAKSIREAKKLAKATEASKLASVASD